MARGGWLISHNENVGHWFLFEGAKDFVAR